MVEPVFIEGEEVVGVNYYPIGNPKFLRTIEIVGDVPAAHVHIEVGGVEQFDGIYGRSIGMTDDFVDQNRIDRQWERIGQSRGATGVSAGLPVGLLAPGIPGSIFVHDLQREAEAIGDWVPTIVICKIEDLFSGGIQERERFARVVERACVLAGDIENASVCLLYTSPSPRDS